MREWIGYQAEFVGWAEETGNQGRGVIVRLTEGGESVLSAVVRLPGNLVGQPSEGEVGQQVATMVRRRAERHPKWVAENAGSEVEWSITEAGALSDAA